MITVSQIRLPLAAPKEEAIARALKIVHLPKSLIDSAHVSKVSVDARKRTVVLVYSVTIFLKEERFLERFNRTANNVRVVRTQPFVMPIGKEPISKRPIICGFGPAGIFCALALARAGYKPIILERGAQIQEREIHIDNFLKTRVLNENSNIQFGEGGAGTFSDGKLTTRINSPLCNFVMQTLIQHKAPKEIAYMQKPHIGTDVLRGVITSIRKEIESLGADIYFNSKITDIATKNGKITHVSTQDAQFECDTLVLAIGHSARDTFEMLNESGMNLQVKPFSVGFRAEHLQSFIDEGLYHGAAGHKALPVGEYQLSQHVGKRCVYTFCMCPGGNVVAAASEDGQTVTNGMSYHARSGKNANAAVVVSVNADDFDNNAFKAMAFQREFEQKAYLLGGSNYTAPAQNASAFIKGEKLLKIKDVEPTYPLGTVACDFAQIFPEELTGCLRQGLLAFDRKIKGFANDSTILTGVETRTSSPIKLARLETGESEDISGIYPCGEGAGYAGGIMSAATDGLNIAQLIAEKFKPF